MELFVKPLYHYLGIKPFKDKDIYILTNMFGNNPTINNVIKQYFLGTINFESDIRDIWNIQTVNEFSRNKINSIIFEIKEDSFYNPLKYKYLIIFQNLTNALNSYGYIWVNESDLENESQNSYTKISIEYIYDNILQSLIQDINTWPTRKLYNAINNIPRQFTVKEMYEIYKEYIETYRALSYDEWINKMNSNQRYKI